jgi:hypothetical protein
MSSNALNLTEEERKRVEEAIKKGKIVMITADGDHVRSFRVEPRDRVELIIRK